MRHVTQMRNEDKDYGDLPRSKKELIDLSKFFLMDNEVGDILAYNEKLNNDPIIWHHSDIPDDVWVIGTENIAVEMSNAITLPIPVDATFKFRAYDITPFTYMSVVLQFKSKNVAKKMGTSNNGWTANISSQQISGCL